MEKSSPPFVARALGVAIHVVGLAKPRLLKSAALFGAAPLSILQGLKIAGADEVHVSESWRWSFL
jgi:hypothetical protein